MPKKYSKKEDRGCIMNNNVRKLIKEYQDEYDNAEAVSAPSGEWAEYNVTYLEKHAAAVAAEDIEYELGSCNECLHFDAGMKDYCKKLNITASPDWYCADFKRDAQHEKI